MASNFLSFLQIYFLNSSLTKEELLEGFGGGIIGNMVAGCYFSVTFLAKMQHGSIRDIAIINFRCLCPEICHKHPWKTPVTWYPWIMLPLRAIAPKGPFLWSLPGCPFLLHIFVLLLHTNCGRMTGIFQARRMLLFWMTLQIFANILFKYYYIKIW